MIPDVIQSFTFWIFSSSSCFCLKCSSVISSVSDSDELKSSVDSVPALLVGIPLGCVCFVMILRR